MTNIKRSLRNSIRISAGLVVGLWLLSTADADWMDARCDIYPKGQDRASASIPCVFSQAQGHIVITRADGVVHDLLPQGDNPGLYTDGKGNRVYRRKGLGKEGQIFQLPDETLYLYWDTAGLPSKNNANSITAPYSTQDYAATARIPCSLNGEAVRGGSDCAAGVNRGPEPGRAVVAIMRKDGMERILIFEGDQVSVAEEGKLEAQLQGEDWRIVIDGGESYLIPQAFLEGD